MPQCSTRVSRSALVAACLCSSLLALSACSVAEMEKMALENAAPADDTSLGGAAKHPEDTGILVHDSNLTGGKRAELGVVGTFRRLLVGPEDEIRFSRPVSVGGTEDSLYVVDADDRIVFKIDLFTKNITPIGDIGPQFVGEPGNIFVSKDGSFYVVDSVGKQVLRFSEDGTAIQRYQDLANLSRPMDVFVDEVTGNVYVADASYSHIVVFNAGGVALGIVGQRGSGPGRFRAITAITPGPEGIYIADRLEIPVQVISRQGQFLYSMGEGHQVYPTSIAVAPDKTVFVGDKSDDTVRIYNNGRLLSVTGGRGSAPGRFREIQSLWVNKGFLYVADSLNKRVQVMKIQQSGSLMTPLESKM